MYLKELEEHKENAGNNTSLLDSFLNSSSIEKREIEGREDEGKRVSILEKVNQVDDDAFLEEANPSQPAHLDSDVVKIEVTDGRVVEMKQSEDVYGGSYIQRDQNVETFESFEDGIEVLSLAHAIEKYDWFGSFLFPYSWIASKYMWRALSKEKNDITRAVAENDVTVEFLARHNK